jgi:ATP/maltotriose-dependent transcriptional regulator MalT/ActR/RegA family two-component response regulator
MKPRAPGSGPHSKPERPTARILLVDDHPLLRKGLRALLEREAGFDVVGEAGDGAEALRQVRALAPDVVVMDVSMPGMTGMEATGRILAEFPGTTVVTLSMYREKTFVDDMLEAGAAAYVLKDSAPEDLVRAIHATLRGECFLSPPILGTVVSGYRASVHASAAAPFILQTKLHRPALPVDLVPRTQALERLESGRTLPLTLVSAPAGYGKSVLIASWLDRTASASAWLSLDHDDGDLRQFATYVVAAVRGLFPEACEESLGLTKAPGRPPVATLAATLSNELGALKRPLILVLDDYHHIKVDSPVNELLQQVVTRPPGNLHVVVVTRRDPPIPLSLLRSRGQLNEIRMRDLRFAADETRALLDASAGFRLTDEALARMDEQLEGWVAGLCLVALSVRKEQDPNAVLERLQGGVQHAQQYLIHEVIAAQPRQMQSWMLKSGILNRFCGPLCAAVCAEPGEAVTLTDGDIFVRTLCAENLFVIPLDAAGEWHRYHQLFQELLAAELQRTLSREEIAALHRRASEWFESRDLPDEAIGHALAAGDAERAADIVERHAEAVIQDGRAYVAARWLRQLPPSVVEGRAGLRRAAVEAGEEAPAPERARPAPAAARPMIEVLTNRELDILELLAERLQNKEIADRLSIAPETVNYHLKHIYQKLNVQSRRQAVTAAFELGLLQRERAGGPDPSTVNR